MKKITLHQFNIIMVFVLLITLALGTIKALLRL